MNKAQYVRRYKDYREKKAEFEQLGVLASLGVVSLKEMIRERSSGHFSHNQKGCERMSHVEIWGRSIPGSEDRDPCKNPCGGSMLG